MLIHDSFSSVGVTLAILRELAVGRPLPVRRALAVAGDLPRRPRTQRLARSATSLRQLAQLPWFVKNVTLKVALKLGLGKLLAGSAGGVPEWPY